MHLGFCRPLKRACNPESTSKPPVETGGYDLKPAAPATSPNGPVIAPAARRTCSRSLRFIPRGLPVNLPPLSWGQDSAKRIVLAQTFSLLGIIEQNASNLGPGTPQNGHPFLRRNISSFDPPRTHLPRMVEPVAHGVAVDLRRDTASHHQAAAIDRLMRLHVTILLTSGIGTLSAIESPRWTTNLFPPTFCAA
jgi:hypothetical protein